MCAQCFWGVEVAAAAVVALRGVVVARRRARPGISVATSSAAAPPRTKAATARDPSAHPRLEDSEHGRRGDPGRRRHAVPEDQRRSALPADGPQ